EPSEEYLSAALEQYSAQYTTRDSMEEAVAQAYGMDTESVKAYLASYSDDELRGMIREQLTTIIKQQYAAQAEERIKEIMTTPSDEELAAVKAQITAQFDSRDVKVAYVMADW